MEASTLIILISLLFSAFFSGMEIAFIAANRLRVEVERKKGGLASQIISIFTKNPGQYIATMLVGNNTALVIYGIYFAKFLEPYIRQYISNVEFNVLLLNTLLSTILILVTAEFLPKTIFRKSPYKFLNALSIPVFLFYVFFYPIAFMAVYFSNKFLKSIFKIKIENKKNILGRVDLDNFLSQGTENKNDKEEIENEVKIFKNALDFKDVKIRECMIPRNEISALEINSEIDDLRKLFISKGFSKILIYKQTIDNIVGYVHIQEIFKKTKTIKAAMKAISAVTETMPANRLLNKFIKDRQSIALVVDEFGGTSGIVTLEDVIEEIFGEIEDEHDQNVLIEQKISDTEYIFSGRTEIDYINEKYNINLPVSKDYETITGFIFHIHEQIPDETEVIDTDDFEIKILKVDKPKIQKVRLIVKNQRHA